MSRLDTLLMRVACWMLPATFRQEYAREMGLLFREEYQRRHGQRFRPIRIWAEMIPDLAETAVRTHLDLLREDLKAWVRLVSRKRMLALGVAGSLAASIALAASMFSVTYAVLLRSLPYQDPGRLVNLDNFPTMAAQDNPGLVREWLKNQKIFAGIAYYSPWQANLDGGGGPVRAEAANVSTSFFSIFGQSVLLGSDFDREDVPYVVLSYGVWQAEFGGDPAIVGKTARLGGQNVRVSGVMRGGFSFPNKTQVWVHANLRDFLNMAEEQQALAAFVVGRLQRGASYAQGADASMALATALVGPDAARFPKAAVPLQRALTEPIRKPVIFLSIAAGLLLALGCASATGLLVARNAARRNDLALCFALGANASRIRRQSLTEGILFGLAGGAIGTWGAYLLVSLAPLTVLPAGIGPVQVDTAVLGAGLLTAILGGAVTGWVAGWNATLRYQAQPRESWNGTAPAPMRMRRWLLAGQLALSVALLVWAGLQFKSLVGLLRTDLGFDPNRLVAATVSFKGSPYRTIQQRRELVDRWQRRISTIPGARAAAISALPMRIEMVSLFRYQLDDGAKARATMRAVSANFIETVGGSIVAGRDFGPQDNERSEPVAIVNEQFAKAVGLAPPQLIGRLVRRDQGRDQSPDQQWRIAGVYRRQATYGPGTEAGPEMSTVLAQSGPTFLSLLVSVPGRPIDSVDPVRAAVRSESPDVAVFDVRPMTDYLAERLAQQRLYSTILGLFAGLSCITSMAGLLSIALFFVSSRQKELGIRMALGATAWQVVGVVMRHGVSVLILGAVAGEALAIAGSRGITSLLVNVAPLDFTVHAEIVFTLVGTGLAAILAASWRAARIDPSVALRVD